MTALDGFNGLALQGQEISKRVSRADATPVLRVERVSKSFGECKAVAEVTFTLGVSEIAAVLGPSGAGKTTLFRCLT
ncbi:MAG: ATP-binding cassette domain-containing protein, partial [Rhodomicrobium sp.]